MVFGKACNLTLTDDEQRLVGMFRCLSERQRSEMLEHVGHAAFERLLPERSLHEFMPVAGGVEPEKVEGNFWEFIKWGGTIVEILDQGAQATGEPWETLFRSSDWDEEEVFPRFAEGAQEVALRQGSFFNYDEAFARKYIPAWRWEIVFACERAAKQLPKDEEPAL